MKAAGIGASVHWMPLHLHPYYRETFGCEPSDCPCATGIYPELVSLPLYPDLADEEVTYVCRTLKEIIARSRVAVRGACIPVAAGKHIAIAR
jgi:perosamine synthetase